MKKHLIQEKYTMTLEHLADHKVKKCLKNDRDM